MRPRPPPADARTAIRDRALALGFDAVGFAAAEGDATARARLAEHLARGHHGDMGWMAGTAERRGDIPTLWPDARTAIVVALNYGPTDDPLAVLGAPSRGAVSVYAGGRDYHDVALKGLRQLARFVADGWGAEVKLFVDTAPIMEKPLAARAGLGWQGKHTNLVSRDFGSWLFLGEVLTSLEIPPDGPETDHCGRCRACLDICPTAAFPAPYQLDSRRCLAYLTNEHKGPIPVEFRAALGNRVYGCDDCLAVCPWNKFAKPTRHEALRQREAVKAPALADLAALDDAGFRARFAGSPIKRIGRDRFLRNVMTAIGNSGDPGLLPVVLARLEDASALVRGAAVWALGRLDPARFEQERVRRLPIEEEEQVGAEWRRAAV